MCKSTRSLTTKLYLSLYVQPTDLSNLDNQTIFCVLF